MGGAGFPPGCLTRENSHAHTATLRAPSPAASHCWPTPPPETPGHSRVSLDQSLVGSLLLSPGSWCTRFCLCLQKSVSQSCESSGSSMVGLKATSSKRAYATPRSAAPRAPAPAAGHCCPVPSQEALTRSSGSVPMGCPGPDVHEIGLSPLSMSGG